MKNNKKKMLKVSKTFSEECSALDGSSLEKLVIESENAIINIRNMQKDDAALQEAKAIVKDLSSGYRDAIKMEREKIDFLLEKINLNN